MIKEVGKHVDASVIITNQICSMDEVPTTPALTTVHVSFVFIFQSDEIWLENVRTLMDATGDLPLGLYETPVPRVR